MAIPNVEATLGVSAPAFVRKLVRPSHWGEEGDEIGQRVATAASEVFRPDGPGVFSVYRIERDEDLRRVAIGLNANRSSLTEVLTLVAFRPDELAACDITPQSSSGETKCTAANARHFDFAATESQVSALCEAAMRAGRNAARLKKPAMQSIVEKAREDGCRAVIESSSHCACDDE